VEGDNMTELEFKFTNDILFKILFTKYPNLLKKLVASILKIPLDDIHTFLIKNPEMPPEVLGEKFCRLDINMDVDGQLIDLEVQVASEKAFAERTMYYWARTFSNSLPASGKYEDLPRAVIVSILAFNQFECEEYYSEFQALEVKRHELLSDKMVYMYFELPKIPKEITTNNDLELWLSLFNAKTEEELTTLEALEVPEMEEAINAYRTITVTPEFREAERLRAKARHDEAQALYNVRLEEKFEFARKLLSRRRPIDEIMEDTGLTRTEVESLRNIS
jgi:predicted transposase/invertase (TIGR01784 family)